jgi:HIRAN domain
MLKRLLGFFRKPPTEAPAPASADATPVATSVPMLKERVQRMRTVEVGRGRFGQAIVGESHYQDALRRAKNDAPIVVGEAPTAAFILAREPDNPHDANAIAVLTEGGEVVGYLGRDDALQLQPTAFEHEQRGEVLACSGKLVGEDLIGVWLNLPHLNERRPEPARPVESLPEYDGVDVCRDVSNVGALIEGRKPYSRSRPNWVGNRIAAIGEERYTSSLERVSKGRCEKGERINLKVLLVPDTANAVDPKAVMVTTVDGDVLGYLAKAHAIRWHEGIQGFFDSARVVCRQAGLHQRTFKSGKRTFYLAIDMTDEDWLGRAASR